MTTGNRPQNSSPGDEPRKLTSFNSVSDTDEAKGGERAGGGRIALYAVAAALITGVVVYGVNMKTQDGVAQNQPAAVTGGTATSGSTDGATRAANVPAPVQNRGPNAQPGSTTGAAPTPDAPALPQQAKSNPTGTEVDRSRSPGTTPAPSPR